MQTALPFVEEHLKERAHPTPSALGASLPTFRAEDQHAASKAERVLLELADYIYAHTSLKPMSKTLFLISRCLLVARKGLSLETPLELENSYVDLCSSLGANAPVDDFDFRTVLAECEGHILHILGALQQVSVLASKTDSLGLAFNTLLRGKFESGEGLGTFLTPEEVVDPMVRMLLGVVEPEVLDRITSGKASLLFGDVCGGTGRFVYSLFHLLQERGLRPIDAERAARLFDQSSLAVEFGRLNFLFDGLSPRFGCVSDSLIAPSVSGLRESFALLATNPPFGIGKYRWSPELSESLSPELLRVLGLEGPDDVADPSELFLFRNLDLLIPGGALGIVLPDGVIQSRRFVNTLRSYERLRGTNISIAALISLPVATFSLGGTVAKTSFLIFRKSSRCEDFPLYVAVARHIGFVKRGNRRLPDVHGNELVAIVNDFLSGKPIIGVTIDSWRLVNRLVPTAICHMGTASNRGEESSPLSDFVDPVKEFESVTEKLGKHHFHVSILDIDETGLIDIVTAMRNQPVTRALRCEPGDILVSCINPKIWRTVCIPEIDGAWTCSPEFLVLRPKKAKQAWGIYLALHKGSVIRAVQALAGGTSSSRQRVEGSSVRTRHPQY